MKRVKDGAIGVDGAKKAKLARLAHARGHGRIPDNSRVGKRENAGAVLIIKGVQDQTMLLGQLLPR